MLTFAAIDIGSNSVRLKIASVERHRLKMLYEDREVVPAGGERISDGGDLSRGDGEYDPRAEAVSEGGATACGGRVRVWRPARCGTRGMRRRLRRG